MNLLAIAQHNAQPPLRVGGDVQLEQAQRAGEHKHVDHPANSTFRLHAGHQQPYGHETAAIDAQKPLNHAILTSDLGLRIRETEDANGPTQTARFSATPPTRHAPCAPSVIHMEYDRVPMEETAARCILITGAVGVGKTSVAAAMASLFEGSRQPYAVVDLDWLAWFRPAQGSPITVQEMLSRNLHAIWPGFRSAGVEWLVLARHVRTVDEVGALRKALREVDLVTVRLEAPRDVLEARIRGRDDEAQVEEHLALLAAAESDDRFEDITIDAYGRTASEVAHDVLLASGWSAALEP
jgi:hypothetical protein